MPDVEMIPFEQFETQPPSSVVVFGGTFDPPHIGHLSVIKKLLNRFQRAVVAPTAQNPWKEAQPTALPIRVEMIRAILAAEAIPITSDLSQTGVTVLTTAYVYAEEVVTLLRSQATIDLFWAVAEDAASGVAKWRNWDKIKVPTLVVPIEINVHATQIRAGEAPLHPSLLPLAAKYGLYGKTAP